MNFLENEFFLLAITFGIFFLAKLLQKKTGIMLLNPILLTIACLLYTSPSPRDLSTSRMPSSA